MADDISDLAKPVEDISDLATPASQQQNSPQNSFQAVGGAAKRWWEGVQQSVQDVRESQNPGQAALRLVGGAAGNVFGAANIPLAGISAGIPDLIKQPIQGAVNQLAGAIGSIPINGVPLSQVYQNMNPSDKTDVNAAANIGALAVAPLASEAGASVAGKMANPINTAARGTGPAMQAIGNKMENWGVMKLTPKEQQAGAKIQNLGKYGLMGNAAQNFDNANSQIKTAAQQLKSVIGNVDFDKADPSTRINIVQQLNSALQDAKTSTKLNKTGMQAIYNDVKANLQESYPNFDFSHPMAIKNNVDLAEAQTIKQEVGLSGDWNTYSGHPASNPDAGTFYNQLYDNLKTSLEDKGGPNVARLNGIMSDLIPIQRAAGKRMLQANSRNPISFRDYLGVTGALASGNPAAVVPAVATRVLANPLTARTVYNVGNLLNNVNIPKVPLQAYPYTVGVPVSNLQQPQQ